MNEWKKRFFPCDVTGCSHLRHNMPRYCQRHDFHHHRRNEEATNLVPMTAMPKMQQACSLPSAVAVSSMPSSTSVLAEHGERISRVQDPIFKQLLETRGRNGDKATPVTNDMRFTLEQYINAHVIGNDTSDQEFLLRGYDRVKRGSGGERTLQYKFEDALCLERTTCEEFVSDLAKYFNPLRDKVLTPTKALQSWHNTSFLKKMTPLQDVLDFPKTQFKWGFHGTKPEDVSSIARYGFRARGNNPTVLGAGVYFASSIFKADQYCMTDDMSAEGGFVYILVLGLNSKRHTKLAQHYRKFRSFKKAKQDAFDNTGKLVGPVPVQFNDIWFDYVSDEGHKRGVGYGEWPEFVVREPKQLKYAAVIKYQRVCTCS